jgi:hypothetical protein
MKRFFGLVLQFVGGLLCSTIGVGAWIEHQGIKMIIAEKRRS